MQFTTSTSKKAAPLGAGVVLGLILLLTMMGDYSRGLPSGEENISSGLEHNLRLAGVSRSSTKRPVTAAKATKRPTVKVNTKPRSAAEIAASSKKVPQITVSKSSSTGPAFDRKASKSNWRFLNRSLRAQIDAAKIKSKRWKLIVIHSSATTTGSAKAFDYYHRKVKNMSHGLAYHFVIGNGNGSGNGRIEVGGRWTAQEAGGHLRSDTQNEVAIGICLVGAFEKTNPSRSQIEALDELVDYLQAKVGKIKVTTHRLVNVRPTLCPGKNFPAKEFVEP